MKYGLPTSAVEKICAVFARFPDIDKTVLYGSRAKGNFKPASDIDLTLFGENLKPAQLGPIAEALDDLLLPYTIDLSLYAELDHAKLREHIDRVGKVFYESPTARQHQGAAMKKGWKRKQLGELAELKGRIGWRGLTAKEYKESGPLFLSVHSLNYGDYVDFRDAFHISEERYIESPEIMLQKDDVLICKDGAGIGKLGILGELPDRTTINSSLLLIRSGKEIHPKFLYRCLTSPYFQQIVNSRLNGATTPHLYQRDITEFPVVLPPLPEQQRIVGLLDEAFEGLATAKANAEKNLQNARALFESHLQSVFTQRGPGWVETTIDKISANLDSKRVPITKNVRTSGEYPYYGASGIVDYVGDYIFEGDNLLVSEDGANLLARSTPIAFSVSGKYWVNNHAHILHFENMATQRFAEFYLGSIKLDDYITGAAQPKLNQKALNSIPIPFPKSSKEQMSVVTKLDDLHEETQHLARLYERKLAALKALKKSLLHQAFSGGL